MGKLDGKVAFITGAARGQGRNHAIRMAEEGADIIIVDICKQIDNVPYTMPSAADLSDTVHAIERAGGRVVAREADVRDVAELVSVVDEGVRRFGRLDIVSVNAGVFGPLEDVPDIAARVANFRMVVDVNLTGAFCTVEASRQALIDSGGGSIIVTSSLAGIRPLSAGGGYSESKHGVVGLMRSYAQQLAPFSIRVNSVHPTNVNTPMIMNDAVSRAFCPGIDDPSEDDVKRSLSFLNMLPVPFVECDDITNAVMWLASDESRYVTGVTLPVDAGGALK
ncbi:mycofactocin-coupled SDR family oxidoreductase [Rhodococcus sp. NCIMB 12038]|uniref:mycofactocin-coupled SDR family oxidoreductase n=1 Tax=Rhodococcus sp. NCIMB 12038 TaxID=933800 RepID=UPI000B3C22CA|nr:mycofactocin-coupled SDR family oxidoreductase [Rhodococcus sp. NCIMB 12038]OUS92343.1 3-ketoacyl-ACP reductase [Rhodococcus sp. NCIMB 12038]